MNALVAVILLVASLYFILLMGLQLYEEVKDSPAKILAFTLTVIALLEAAAIFLMDIQRHL